MLVYFLSMNKNPPIIYCVNISEIITLFKIILYLIWSYFFLKYNMDALILAAGTGSRMGGIDSPKCLLNIVVCICKFDLPQKNYVVGLLFSRP